MKKNKIIPAMIAVATAAILQTSPVNAADAPWAAAPEPIAAKQRFVKMGLLTCINHGGFGYVIGSSHDLTCTFKNMRGNRSSEQYDGSITKVGPDIGYKQRGKLVWAVYAPSYQVPEGRLDGTYLGVSAEVGLGVGLGANVLTGNLKNNLNLVPVSVSSNIGLNASVGIGALTLTSASASQ